MPRWYFTILVLLRDLRSKAWDARDALVAADVAAAKLANSYMKQDYRRIVELWQREGFPAAELGNLGRHIRFGELHDYDDIIRFDIDFIANNAEGRAQGAELEVQKFGFEDLLHPVIEASSLRHYREGDYRNAVLDAMVALSDLIRSRTGLKGDGKSLVTEAFSLSRPKLIFSELVSESGQNDQIGFMEMISGA